MRGPVGALAGWAAVGERLAAIACESAWGGAGLRGTG